MRELAATGALDVRRFYLRRVLRIWPLYFAYLFTLAIAGMFFAPFHLPAKWLIMFVLLSGNLANSLWGWPPIFLAVHLWSVSLEEQFYLVWPLLMRRRRPGMLVGAAFAMLAVSACARTVCWFASAPKSLIWTNTLTRLDPFAAGILLAVWTMKGPLCSRPVERMALLLVGLATMVLISAFCDPYWNPNSALNLFLGYPAVALGCVAILASFLGMKISLANGVIRSAVYLGKISYGLYVWHLLALELVKQAVARPIPLVGEWIDSSIFITLAALGVTIAIAAASYRFLEAPFLRLKLRFELIPSRPT